MCECRSVNRNKETGLIHQLNLFLEGKSFEVMYFKTIACHQRNYLVFIFHKPAGVVFPAHIYFPCRSRMLWHAAFFPDQLTQLLQVFGMIISRWSNELRHV